MIRQDLVDTIASCLPRRQPLEVVIERGGVLLALVAKRRLLYCGIVQEVDQRLVQLLTDQGEYTFQRANTVFFDVAWITDYLGYNPIDSSHLPQPVSKQAAMGPAMEEAPSTFNINLSHFLDPLDD